MAVHDDGAVVLVASQLKGSLASTSPRPLRNCFVRVWIWMGTRVKVKRENWQSLGKFLGRFSLFIHSGLFVSFFFSHIAIASIC